MSKADRWITSFAILLLLLCGGALYYSDLWMSNGSESTGENIGVLSTKNNDTRHKGNQSFAWLDARKGQKIHVGDSLFSGLKSSAHVDMIDGSGIDMGENSLITFSNSQGLKMPNLQGGIFNLKVNGQVRVAVQGHITTIDGKNSEVEVRTKPNGKPEFRVLKGQMQIQPKRGTAVKAQAGDPILAPMDWSEPEIATVETNPPDVLGQAANPKDIAAQVPVTPAPPPPPVAKPEPLPMNRQILHFWHLYDVYSAAQGKTLIERPEEPEQVQESVEVHWIVADPGKKVQLQYDSKEDFTKPQTLATTGAGEYAFEQVYMGNNYFRISYDGANWSPTQNFQVRGAFRQDLLVQVQAVNETVPLLNGLAEIEWRLQPARRGYVAELSTTEDFAANPRQTFWTATQNLNLRVTKPGLYYFHARGVDTNEELSPWSPTTRVRVFQPMAPQPPVIELNLAEGQVGQGFSFRAITKEPVVKMQILDKQGHVIAEGSRKELNWLPNLAGDYQVRGQVLSKYGLQSAWSKPESVKVEDGTLLQSEDENSTLRRPAQTASEPPATTSTRIREKILSYINEKYKSTQLSLAGFLWTLFSSQQVYQNADAPTATGLGVHGEKWYGKTGIEGSFDTAVLGINKAGQESSVHKLEGRVHHRFLTGFPFGWTRELSISPFLGAEYYTNSGANFIKSYQMLKLGTHLQFPWRQHWSTGGEFVYGLGLDQSHKYEISGNLNYFINFDWSFGVGYRLHLYESGPTTDVPGGFYPYRESYTEGFSVLTYHY